MAKVIHTYEPITAGVVLDVDPGHTISGYLEVSGTVLSGPVVCAYNGRPALRDEWDDIVIADNDVVIFLNLPGNNQEGGSNPARIAGMIGIMALAFTVPGMAPAAWGLVNASGGLTFMGAMVSAGINIAGTMALNAIIPEQIPQVGTDAITAPDNTYSLNVPNNMAKLNGTKPVQFGRIKRTPPLAWQAWSEYIDNEQYVYIGLALGQGYFAVHQMLFGLLNFNDVSSGLEYSVLDPGASQPYENNVYSVGVNQELRRTNDYSATHTMWLFANGKIQSDYDNEKMLQFQVDDIVQVSNTNYNNGLYTVTEVGQGNNSSYIIVDSTLTEEESLPGVTVACATDWIKYTNYVTLPESGQQTSRLDFDIVCPGGLYTASTTDTDLHLCTVEFEIRIQEINLSGLPIGGEVVYTAESIEANTNQPIRKTYSYTNLPWVTYGKRYKVRLARKAASTSTLKVDTIHWVSVKAFLPKTSGFADVTTIAIKAQATDGLNGDALSNVKVVSTAKKPKWDGNSWSEPVATSSIAWAAADWCRNNKYSIGLDDSFIDLDKLLALDAIWTARTQNYMR